MGMFLRRVLKESTFKPLHLIHDLSPSQIDDARETFCAALERKIEEKGEQGFNYAVQILRAMLTCTHHAYPELEMHRNAVENFWAHFSQNSQSAIVRAVHFAWFRSEHAGTERVNSTINELKELRHFDYAYEGLKNFIGISICDDCGDFELAGEMVETTDGSYVCRNCIENYSYSDYEGAYVPEDRLVSAIAEIGGSRVFIDCDNSHFYYSDHLNIFLHESIDESEAEDYFESDSIIGGYHSHKRSYFEIRDDWSKLNKMLFGVELEVEVSDNVISRNQSAMLVKKATYEIMQTKDILVFENDGSLNYGYEMISQPMSLPNHRKLWRFLQSPEVIVGLRSHKTNSCGLHVHMSRSNLRPIHVAKIGAFINKPENAALIYAIARRKSSSYCKIKNKKTGQFAQSDDRYEAVNLTNRHTIEFRIFRGSLKYESVISAIEFCWAVVEFTRSASAAELNVDKFMLFINTKLKQETKFLREYLKVRFADYVYNEIQEAA